MGLAKTHETRGQARRGPLTWTVVGLVLLAVASGLLAFLFLELWASRVEANGRRLITEQGRDRGELIRRRLDGLMQAFLDRNAGRTADRWVHDFPIFLDARLREDFAGSTAVLVNEVAVLETGPGLGRPAGVVARLGTPLAAYPPTDEELPGGLRLALQDGPEATLIVVEGPVFVPEGAPPGLREKGYRFRAWLEVPPFDAVVAEGKRLAAILVVVFWLALWVVVLLVYWIGRRQESSAFRARERTIRLAAMTSVAEGIAHEIRNPLNGIALNVQYLEKLQERDRKAGPEDFRRVQDELRKIKGVVDDFVNFSRLRDIELDEVDLVEVLDAALAALEPLADDVGATVRRRIEGDLVLRADRAKLVQALRHVLENALLAVADAGDREIVLAIEGARDRVLLRVENGGRSPEPGVLESMFDPFFSTRSSAIGLGLTLAKTVVEAHGGSISARGRNGGGCVVELALPRIG